MTENDLLEMILDRLGRSEITNAVFGTDETATWPLSLLDTFTESRLLRPTKAAQVITCDGCEQYCPMPVTVLPAESTRPARSFIACDKRDDIGRVPVDLKRLEQWEINGSLLAKTLSSLMAFDKTVKEESKGKRWTLGTVKGKERKSQLVLNVENGVFIEVAGHDVALGDVLSLKNGTLTVDRDELLRLVDKPLAEGVSAGKTSTTRNESRKQASQKRYAAWKKAYKELKRKRSNMSDVWYSQQIEKMDIAENRDAETIRKHMKK